MSGYIVRCLVPLCRLGYRDTWPRRLPDMLPQYVQGQTSPYDREPVWTPSLLGLLPQVRILLPVSIATTGGPGVRFGRIRRNRPSWQSYHPHVSKGSRPSASNTHHGVSDIPRPRNFPPAVNSPGVLPIRGTKHVRPRFFAELISLYLGQNSYILEYRILPNRNIAKKSPS